MKVGNKTLTCPKCHGTIFKIRIRIEDKVKYGMCIFRDITIGYECSNCVQLILHDELITKEKDGRA